MNGICLILKIKLDIKPDIMTAKSIDIKRNKITNMFIWGTIILICSTVLLTITLYFDNVINKNKNIIETYDTNHNEYLSVDLMNSIYQNTFKLTKLLKDQNSDTTFKKFLLHNLDSTIHRRRVECAILQYPGDIVVNEDMQKMLFALPPQQLDENIKINNDKNIEILNKVSKKINNNQKAKTYVTYFIILLQIIGLGLNQRALILRIKYKI
jgi:hypothetical protein